MVRINLLPWRSMAREENSRQRKYFFIVLSGLISIGLISHLCFYFILQTTETSISELKNQLTELIDQNQQNQINPSETVGEQIKSSQNESIQFLTALTQCKQILEICSDILTQRNHIIIIGNSDSELSLAQIVNLYNSTHPLLSMTIMSVKENEGNSGLQFHLQLTRTVSPLISQIKNDDEIS